MDIDPLALNEFILKNANDVVQAFFKNGVAVDYKAHIAEWVKRKIPNPKLLSVVVDHDIKWLGQSAFLGRDFIKSNLDQPEVRRALLKINSIADALGFKDTTGYVRHAEWLHLLDHPKMVELIDDVIPTLAKNADRLSHKEWFHLHHPDRVAEAIEAIRLSEAARKLDQRTIYETVVDHIKINAPTYAGIAAATIAGAVAYYLYKLYRSGVSNTRAVKSAALNDSKRIEKRDSKRKSVLITRRSLSKVPSSRKILSITKNSRLKKSTGTIRGGSTSAPSVRKKRNTHLSK